MGKPKLSESDILSIVRMRREGLGLREIGRKLGLDHTGLRAVAKQRYGVVPEHLTKAQASEFIGSLSEQANGNGLDHDDQVDEMGA